MADPLQQAEALRDHPPAAPPPLDTVRARARRLRRTRRRRIGFAAALAVSLTAGVTAALAGAGRDAAQHVRTAHDPGATTAPPATATGPGRTAAAVMMRVEPSVGVVDRQWVTVRFAPVAAATSLIVDQCLPGVTRERTGDDCTGSVQGPMAVTAAGVKVQLRRSILVKGRRIDCADRPGRCVLAALLTTKQAGVNRGAGLLVTPLAFRPGGPLPAPNVRLTAAPGATRSGPLRYVVSGSGFEPGEEVTITTCTPSGTVGAGRCGDNARVRRFTADAAGRFRVDYLHYRLQFDGRAWTPCDRTGGAAASVPVPVCAVAVLGGRSGGVTTDEPVNPLDAVTTQVRVATPGPLGFGQRVELVGSGFQVAGEPVAAWCRDGDAGGCVFPREGVGARVDRDGSFSLAGFPLPGADRCAPPNRCFIGWEPEVGASSVYRVPLALR
ncbi:MAG: hypothetical protein JWN46_3336 [Acidimicrobiales bacterium]|nr:hypothetical protein [Acidimicrobiales bacterium]